jgi:hypothetical protein
LTYDRGARLDVNSNVVSKAKHRNRPLRATELAKFRAAFTELRICGAKADNLRKDGGMMLDGWSMGAEFANETRHCYLYREAIGPKTPTLDHLFDLLRSFEHG